VTGLRGWTTLPEANVIHVAADQRPSRAAELVWYECKHLEQRRRVGADVLQANYEAFEHEADVFSGLKFDDPHADVPSHLTRRITGDTPARREYRAGRAQEFSNLKSFGASLS
jgi:hypothetical protein